MDTEIEETEFEKIYAIDDPRSAAFMIEFLSLCAKHGLAILPAADYSGEIDTGETMVIAKYDSYCQAYYRAAGIPTGELA